MQNLQFPMFLLINPADQNGPSEDDVPFVMENNRQQGTSIWPVFSSKEMAAAFMVGVRMTHLRIAEFITATDLLTYMTAFRPKSVRQVWSREEPVSPTTLQFHSHRHVSKFFSELEALALAEKKAGLN